MKIGFIGAGNVTRTFGHHLINAGHTIVVSNPEVRRPWLILSLILVQAPSRGLERRRPSATSLFSLYIG